MQPKYRKKPTETIQTIHCEHQQTSACKIKEHQMPQIW